MNEEKSEFEFMITQPCPPSWIADPWPNRACDPVVVWLEYPRLASDAVAKQRPH
jgi:hypothetical protein